MLNYSLQNLMHWEGFQYYINDLMSLRAYFSKYYYETTGNYRYTGSWKFHKNIGKSYGISYVPLFTPEASDYLCQETALSTISILHLGLYFRLLTATNTAWGVTYKDIFTQSKGVEVWPKSISF